MDKKRVIIIGIIIAIIAIVGSIAYLTYVADYTYEDDRISISVPAQTKFTINATHDDYWTFVNYESNDKNNISIKICKLDSNQNISFLGIPLDVFGMTKSATILELTENQSYKAVNITENYTVYYNSEKNKYIALIFDANKQTIVIISCDNSSELINKLASSFILKTFTTTGLKIVTIDNNFTSADTNTSTSDNTYKSEKSDKSKYDRYVEDAMNDPRGDGTKDTAMSEEEFYESGQDKYY
ncbi:hypothetical protein [Methanobrevibacter sp.]|uniref:hypothetical protein n=1 Tax=Methanobrevibacter sp. TaxID=66852 RepID=UPI002604E1AC|nr:hypothetical protein [uncultured Methanobrevibacter sp.]